MQYNLGIRIYILCNLFLDKLHVADFTFFGLCRLWKKSEDYSVLIILSKISFHFLLLRSGIHEFLDTHMFNLSKKFLSGLFDSLDVLKSYFNVNSFKIGICGFKIQFKISSLFHENRLDLEWKRDVRKPGPSH